MKLFRNLFKCIGFKIASDKGNEILKYIGKSESNAYKQKIIKLYNLHFVRNNEVAVCSYFVAKKDGTSATTCEFCGHEKFAHEN